jgi:threonine dehydratase
MLQNYVKKILSSRVYDVAVETPLQAAPNLSRRAGCSVLLKREDLQPVFSFKIRGAYNKIAQLSAAERARGVIAASAGNHAQGVALAARELGIKATIVMGRNTPSIKVDAVRAFGARVVLHGDTYDDAAAHAAELVERQGPVYIPPYDDLEVIAGQGTVGMEIMKQHAGAPDAIFVPVGGGGLVAGIAAYVKYLSPATRIVGVEAEGSACLAAALASGRRVTLPYESLDLFADGVSVAQVGREPFKVAKHCVDEVIVASTDEICAAIKDLFEDTRSIAEPAGALAVAGLKKWVAREAEAARCNAAASLVAVSAAPTSTSTACGISPSAPRWASSARSSSPSPFPSSRGSFRRFCPRSASARSASSTTATPTRAGRTSTSACRSASPDDRATVIGLLGGRLRGRGHDRQRGGQAARPPHGGRPLRGRQERAAVPLRVPRAAGGAAQVPLRAGRRLEHHLFHYRNHGAAWGRVLVGLRGRSRRAQGAYRRPGADRLPLLGRDRQPGVPLFLR